MSTQYVEYGIVAGRTHTSRELELLRTVELARAERRRQRRARRLFAR